MLRQVTYKANDDDHEELELRRQEQRRRHWRVPVQMLSGDDSNDDNDVLGEPELGQDKRRTHQKNNFRALSMLQTTQQLRILSNLHLRIQSQTISQLLGTTLPPLFAALPDFLVVAPSSQVIFVFRSFNLCFS